MVRLSEKEWSVTTITERANIDDHFNTDFILENYNEFTSKNARSLIIKKKEGKSFLMMLKVQYCCLSYEF